jgi:hypothetical protein
MEPKTIAKIIMKNLEIAPFILILKNSKVVRKETSKRNIFTV